MTPQNTDVSENTTDTQLVITKLYKKEVTTWLRYVVSFTIGLITSPKETSEPNGLEVGDPTTCLVDVAEKEIPAPNRSSRSFEQAALATAVRYSTRIEERAFDCGTVFRS
jgi:hypothetical protein